MADLDIDIPELAGLVRRYGNIGSVVQDELRRAGDRSGAIVVRRAVLKVRRKTGALARSVAFATTVSGFAVETKVGTDVKYGRYLDEGTGIYGPKGAPIRPTRAKFLVFEIGGKTVFARSVRGVPGDKWFTGSWEESKPEVRREFGEVPKRIVNRVTKGG
jgi:Bacteriophage HK97-gp10, putative tail-component